MDLWGCHWAGGCGPALRVGVGGQVRHMGLCFPGSSDPSAVIRGPGEVTGPEQGWLTVQCHYEPRWEPYVKYWCQGAEFISCKFLVKTTGSNWEVKRDRVSIRDNQTSHTFTVTME